MTKGHILYKEGYEYVLAVDYQGWTRVFPERFVYTPFIRLESDGTISITAGYAWDGPSGPTIDTPDFMRGSLVHDALYQLIREGHLPQAARAQADETLREICLEDGMPRVRADYVYAAVRAFGGMAASRPVPVLKAPRDPEPNPEPII